MNSYHFLIICFLFIMMNGRAQETNFTPIHMNTDAVFVSVYFSDENLGWVIGRLPDHKTSIFKTIDGGDSWVEQQRELPLALTSIYFTGSENGWAVGENGVIIHTNNGGKSWYYQGSGTRYNLNSVYFIDSNTGWAAGIFGRILHTTDGGRQWRKQYTGNSFNFLNSVYFVNSQLGWMVGDGGVIFKTVNGGINWTLQDLSINNDLNAVCFADSNHGCIVGQNAIILSTSDGGSTWNFPKSFTGYLPQDNNDLYSVCAADIRTFWAVGRDGLILNTLNGGSNWRQINSRLSNNLYSVYFHDENIGWTVGSFGTILRYENIVASQEGQSLSVKLPKRIELKQNFPNPFNPITVISWQVAVRGPVNLSVYNVAGQRVAALINEIQPAGSYSLEFDASNLASGVYMYRLESGDLVESKKMILMQ